MKYTSALIQKYLSVKDTPENIANNLILKTVEIEEILKREISPNIVIGKVIECKDHPDSDHMHVCQVDCGAKGKFQIVCGAENVTTGLFVPVALAGTYFPKAGITIAPRKLRGVESNGMICSKGELEIPEDGEHPWIWDLKQDVEVEESDLGTPLTQKFPRLNAFILEVDSKGLTNRPDLTGHFGLARELNAMYQPQGLINYTKLPELKQTFELTNIFEVLKETNKKGKKQIITQTQDLNTYILLEIDNVKVKKSDFFLRLQLLDIGNGGVNNWVDFGNLFMNITGQPVHFFDADKVEGNIIVRNAKAGETFVDLFGKEHQLIENDVLICDEKKILCLGGVMGGENSGVTDSTKNILVEIANFNPVALRKTGVRLGLRTDSELRNEKHINPIFSLYALLLLLDELKFYQKDLGNYEVGGVSRFASDAVMSAGKKTIAVDREIIEKSISSTTTADFPEKSKEILKGLGFDLLSDTTVSVPLRRGPDDLQIPEDITEEVARIRGYEKIESIPASTPLVHQRFEGEVELLRDTERFLVERAGLTQVETYPRIAGKETSSVALQNPVNPEAPILRESFLPQFLEIAGKNSKFYDEFKIFDTGKLRVAADKSQGNEPFSEMLTTGIVLYKKVIKDWSDDALLEMKAIIENLIKALGIDGKITYQPTQHTQFCPKKQGNILYNGEVIGYLGALHPITLKKHKLPENANVLFAELNQKTLNTIKTAQEGKTYPYETIQDQILRRDLSFVVDETSDFSALLAKIGALPEVKELEVFDVYQGENLPAGKKSISLKFKLIGEGNMTSEEVGAVMQKAIDAATKVGAELRG